MQLEYFIIRERLKFEYKHVYVNNIVIQSMLKLNATWRNRMLDFHSKEIKLKVSCWFTEGIYKSTEDLTIVLLIYKIEVDSKLDF